MLKKKIFEDNWGLLAVGGLSLIFFVLYHFFVSQESSLHQLAWLMYYLSFLVNWPHFMLSYQLLYYDFRKELFKKKSFVWAAWIVPLMLLMGVIYSFTHLEVNSLGWFVKAMFILVGWHYVKQVFGVIVVSSARASFFLKDRERFFLLLNLHLVWLLSFVAGQYQSGKGDFYGISYDFIKLPSQLMPLLYGAVFLSLLLTISLFVKRWLETGETIHKMGIFSFVSLYAWYIPLAHHSHFIYMIPFFHSLQYLIFPLVLKTSQWDKENKDIFSQVEKRRYLIKKNTFYFGSSFVLGILFFYVLPHGLDKYWAKAYPLQSEMFKGTLFLGVFHLFINVHHYFIDNVLWKKDNNPIKEFLLG